MKKVVIGILSIALASISYGATAAYMTEQNKRVSISDISETVLIEEVLSTISRKAANEQFNDQRNLFHIISDTIINATRKTSKIQVLLTKLVDECYEMRILSQKEDSSNASRDICLKGLQLTA